MGPNLHLQVKIAFIVYKYEPNLFKNTNIFVVVIFN